MFSTMLLSCASAQHLRLKNKVTRKEAYTSWGLGAISPVLSSHSAWLCDPKECWAYNKTQVLIATIKGDPSGLHGKQNQTRRTRLGLDSDWRPYPQLTGKQSLGLRVPVPDTVSKCHHLTVVLSKTHTDELVTRLSCMTWLTSEPPSVLFCQRPLCNSPLSVNLETPLSLQSSGHKVYYWENMGHGLKVKFSCKACD